MKQGDELEFKLNQSNTVVIKCTNTQDRFSYTMKHNDKQVISEHLSSRRNLKVYLVGNSLIYVNTEEGHQNYMHVYLMTVKGLRHVYQMDKVEGMIPSEFIIQDDRFTIRASRMDGTNINFGAAAGVDICDKTTWYMGINNYTVIGTDYTFKIFNTMLDNNSSYSNTITIQDYLNQNPGLCG